MNIRDSEIMAQSLSRYGYVEGMDLQEADLVILNTSLLFIVEFCTPRVA